VNIEIEYLKLLMMERSSLRLRATPPQERHLKYSIVNIQYSIDKAIQ